jgi:hypothetical protein
MYNFKRKALTIIFISYCVSSFGQNSSQPVPNVLTADSLASGTYKDVLTSFFQLALNDLSGKQKAVDFTSNPFALMVKTNPNLLIDSNYVKYKHLRDLNFSFGVNLDSTYNLNGFNFGIKYALVNKRNIDMPSFLMQNMARNKQFADLNNSVNAWISLHSTNGASDRDFALSLFNQFHRWEDDSTFTFHTFDERTRDTIIAIITRNNLDGIQRSIASNPNFSFKKATDSTYNDINGKWQNKPLWTIGVNSALQSSNSNNFKNIGFNNLNITSEFLAGLNSPKNRIKLDLDILASDAITNDTTQPNKTLNRNLFEFQPGIDFVLKTKGSGGAGKPYLELKVSGSYYHTFSTLLPGQKADSNTINGELRIRLYQDLWVPITIKYDPSTGNVFGFLSVKANFTSMASVVKKLQGN